MGQGSGESPKELAEVGLARMLAFRDIARGEQTAAALERQLSGVERRLDELLATLDADPQSKASATASSQSSTSRRGVDGRKKDEGNGS
ncbi:MAG: hypothetical protein M1816_005796 [Peltula sp. TS41687]|nr:MAG: hypothetical protein M1816_005796 [Peltula sp. TS41687]